MAKRFTDNTKWNTQFVRSLKPAYKLLWLYIHDECNHSGIWDVDFEVAQIKIGTKVDLSEAVKLFSGKISILEDGNKWFIPSFIELQYGVLAENNRAHTQVISQLIKYNLLSDELKIKPLTSPLDSPLQGAKEQEQDKEKDKEQEKVQSDIFIGFLKWQKENAPEVARMKNPITEIQLNKLLEKFDAKKIKNVILEMHNWKPLNTKRTDAYLTFLAFEKNSNDTKQKDAVMANGLTEKENKQIFG